MERIQGGKRRSTALETFSVDFSRADVEFFGHHLRSGESDDVSFAIFQWQTGFVPLVLI